MMGSFVVTRSVTSLRGVISTGRIPQPEVANARQFYSFTCTSNRASNKLNIVHQNNFVQSMFLIKRGDHAICVRTIETVRLPQNKIHRAMLSSTSSDGSTNKITEENPFNMRRTSNVNEDDLPPITLDNTIRMKNAVLALTLVAGCVGIMYYSMHAVGQAGTGPKSTNDSDPLAVLKAEAAIAKEQYEKEQQATANTADMLQKFQQGEYDPDHVSDEELDDLLDPKKKRPWWKFW